MSQNVDSGLLNFMEYCFSPLLALLVLQSVGGPLTDVHNSRTCRFY